MASELNDENYGLVLPDDSVDHRRVDPEERTTYEAKRLWQLHHEIINLDVLGYKQVDIAKILNVTPQTVSNVLNSGLAKEKLVELRAARDGHVKARLEQIRVLTDKAMNVYHEVFDNEMGEFTPKDRVHVADVVALELSGLRVPLKTQSASMIITPQQYEDFKKRGIQAAKESGMCIPDEDVKDEYNGSNKET
jgi:DNA-binding MarR family transcriptional regulator